MKFSTSILLLLSPLLVLSEKHGSSPIVSHNRMALLKRGSQHLKELNEMFAVLDTTNSTTTTTGDVTVKDTTGAGGILDSIISGLTGGSQTTSSDSSSATSSTSSSTTNAATTTTTDAASSTSSSSDASSSTTATSSTSDSSSSSSATSSSSSSSSSQTSSTSQSSTTTISSPTSSSSAASSSSTASGKSAVGSSSNSVVAVTVTATSASSVGTLSSNTAAESANTTNDKKSDGLSGIELAGIIIGSSVVGILLIFTVIRKWVFKPSSRFEDKLNPIDFGDDQPGFNSNFNFNSSTEKPLPSTSEQHWETFSVTNSAEQHDRAMSEVSSQKATATLNGGKTIEWPQVPLPPIPSAMGGMRSNGSLKRGDSWGSNGGRSLNGVHTQINMNAGGYERSMTPVQGAQAYSQLPYPGEARRPNEGQAFDPYYRGGF